MCQKLDRFQTAGWVVEIGIRKTYIIPYSRTQTFLLRFQKVVKM